MSQLLLHGLGQEASSWDKTVAGLVNMGDIICPKLVDFVEGKECSYQSLYESLSLYCRKSDVAVSICGLSLGAVFGLNFAIDNPQKVRSLVLIAPQYKMPKTLLRLQNIIFRFMPNSAFRGMGFNKSDFIKLTNSMIDLDFSGKLKDISCPTLVICGEKDKANRAACEKIAAAIPNAKFEIIKNAGHEVNIDAPEELSAAINLFMNRL